MKKNKKIKIIKFIKFLALLIIFKSVAQAFKCSAAQQLLWASRYCL